MKRAALLIVFLLLVFPAIAPAQYNIRLKNGSVIEGVGNYAEVDGQLKFQYGGGLVSVPIEEVENIEEARTGGRVMGPGEFAAPSASAPGAATMPPEPPPMKFTAEAKEERQRLSEVDQRLREIGAEEAKYSAARGEYDRVRLRIEVLFQKGIAEAKKQGGDPGKWFQFLEGQEREWVQLNTLKKKKLETDLKEMEARLAPLLQEKKMLLGEKETLQAKIEEIESPY